MLKINKLILGLVVVSMVGGFAPATKAFAYSIKQNNGGYDIDFGYNDNGFIVIFPSVYYLHHGEAKMGWIYIDSNWYYLNSHGSMVINQWVNDSGNWYYLNYDGKLATNCYVDGYYVDENGSYIASRNNLSLGSGIYYENGNEVYTTVYKMRHNGSSDFIGLYNTPTSISYNVLRYSEPYPVVINGQNGFEGKDGQLVWFVDEKFF